MTWHVSLRTLVGLAFRRVSLTEAAEKSLTDDRLRSVPLSAYCYIPLQLLWPMLTSRKGWLRCYHYRHAYEENEWTTEGNEGKTLTRKLLARWRCGDSRSMELSEEFFLLEVNRCFGVTCRLQNTSCHLFSRCFLVWLILRTWRWRRHIRRNVAWLSTDYTSSYPRRRNSS
jgi:hypothetical protein